MRRHLRETSWSQVGGNGEGHQDRGLFIKYLGLDDVKSREKLCKRNRGCAIVVEKAAACVSFLGGCSLSRADASSHKSETLSSNATLRSDARPRPAGMFKHE